MLAATMTPPGALAQALEHVLERGLEVVGVLPTDDVIRACPDRDEIRLELAPEQALERGIEPSVSAPGIAEQGQAAPSKR